ncbi:MAG: hypothetical protein KJ900_04025 [Proteobacteria bacterium]|jgi:hypothetical protein|nr:hypothetical protein [Desulfocapsa sp.]MBU3944500.1 hypothetical protein [Pseudomonadota bacterium]MBU3982018.1 hypothetical protein [Pseudomonadota bacterium]MBU4029332.1 hypothetical protein [Pseudomonadota bacterium]MBU4042050.1 hypothetical protein [Pseudomonadota bacterium]
MQIDFHHATTYVAARLAGFPQDKAEIVAYAAQYVDDATCSGIIRFNNIEALYSRISSAHEMLDLRNADELANHLVWIPFHFLPGNDGLGEGQNPIGTFIDKLVCKPDSPIARQMVRQAIVDQDRPYGLHRLGIAMHVYADTWAHQSFAGILHKINEVNNVKETSNSGVFSSGLGSFLSGILDDTIPPLGHGRATVFPDMPFLSWSYKNGRKETIARNNTDQFCQAAEQLCRAMKRYIAMDPYADVSGIKEEDMNKIQDLFVKLKEENGDKRHKAWLQAIKNEPFSFGSEKISYSAKGTGSWKEQTLGTNDDKLKYPWTPVFLKSNWKFFHDALQAHRFYVIYDLLPKFGICVA